MPWGPLGMRYVLVYDADCGPCTRFRKAVEFLDTKGRMGYMGLAEADRAGVLDSVSPGRRRRSFHLASPSGTVWSAADALAPLCALLPGGRPLSAALAMCPPVSSMASFVYGAFSRLHDAGSCGYRPGGPREPSTPPGPTAHDPRRAP